MSLQEEGRVGESQSHPGASAMSSVVGFVGSTTWGGAVKGWSHGHLSVWRDGAPGPTAAASQSPVSTGATVVGRLELYALHPTPPPLLGFLGLQTQLLWPEGWNCRHHVHCAPSSAFSMCSNPPTFRCIQMCGVLWCPSVLGRGALLRCGYLPGCRLKGRDKSEVSFCHVAYVSPQT